MPNAVGKALEILRILGQKPDEPMLLGAIAERLACNSSTCACILKTMVEYGFVDQPIPRKGYTLGPMAYSVTRSGPYRKDIVIEARPIMEALAKEIGETVLLAGLRGDRRVLLEVVEGKQEVQVRPAGSVLDDIYLTATGRVLLGHMSEEKRLAFVQRHGLPGSNWPEANSQEELERLFAQMRHAGFLISRADQHVQIAFPIFESGEVVAALGVPVPAFRFTPESEQRLLDAGRVAADAIGRQLPYRKVPAKSLSA